MKNDYDVVIGLEIHIESKTDSKMFCGCKNDPDERRPNINICPVCMGHPGTLPVINKQAIKNIIKLGLALNCKIAKYSKFDRKNYFYPDLPKGYQISQFDLPICSDGSLKINGKKIRVNRIHQEEDAGRLAHSNGDGLVDFNRAGLPLIELVTEPDINSAEEAVAFAKELQLIARYLGVADANMEKGEMRCEVNISLKPKGAKGLGTKVEVKNLNSFKSVEKSIQYEIERQSGILDEGGKIDQETRGWHDSKQVTISQRGKEDSYEYRYFPEPDLPPLEIDQKMLDEAQKEIPELPQNKRERIREEYGIEDSKTTEIFIEDKGLFRYFEEAVSELKKWAGHEKIDNYFDLIKLAINYLTTDLLGMSQGGYLGEKIDPENFAEFIILIYKGDISSKIAKMVLTKMYNTKRDPSNIIEEEGLSQISGDDEIEKIVKEVIGSNRQAVEDYKNGKQNSFQFLIGQIMAKSKGRVNPQKAEELLKKNL